MRTPGLGWMWVLVVAGFFSGCASRVDRRAIDEAQIRARIAAIRSAILGRDAQGIVQFGTADWSFTGADAKTYDRGAYLVRTGKLFAGIEAIESLETQIDRVHIAGDQADVEITQTMVRRERAGEDHAAARVWLRYRERHAWIRAADGWRVRKVEFLGTPERKILPERP